MTLSAFLLIKGFFCKLEVWENCVQKYNSWSHLYNASIRTVLRLVLGRVQINDIEAVSNILALYRGSNTIIERKVEYVRFLFGS